MSFEKQSISDSIRNQMREDGGKELKNPEKFQLEQKYGLIDPILTEPEQALIRLEVAKNGR